MLMPFDDHSSGHSRHQFRQLQPAKEQDREEEDTAPRERSTGVQRLAVKQGAHNQSVGDDDKEFGVQRSLVSPQEPDLSLHTCCNLSRKGDCVGGPLRYRFTLGCLIISRHSGNKSRTENKKTHPGQLTARIDEYPPFPSVATTSRSQQYRQGPVCRCHSAGIRLLALQPSLGWRLHDQAEIGAHWDRKEKSGNRRSS
jgi:hypothetical protein